MPPRPLLALALGLAVLVSGCSTDDPTAASATPTPTASPAPLVVAVERTGRQLELYTVGADRHATLLRRLDVPSGTHWINDITLSTDASPRLCALFFGPEGGDSPGPSALGCYERGASTPVIVQGTTDENSSLEPYVTVGAALRPDGAAIAYLDGLYWYQYDVVTADWDGRSLSHKTHIVTDPARPLSGTGEAARIEQRITGLSWAGPSSLLLDTYVDGGDSTARMLQLGKEAERRGWLAASTAVTPPGEPSSYYFFPASGNSGTSAYGQHRQGSNSRAVRVDLHGSAVAEVVSVPAGGRDILGVSGGSKGVVYATYDVQDGVIQDYRFYVRFGGQAHGRPIIGLPRDTIEVIAQP